MKSKDHEILTGDAHNATPNCNCKIGIINKMSGNFSVFYILQRRFENFKEICKGCLHHFFSL